MTLYVGTETFCDELAVERYAVYDFDESSSPTSAQVYEYAKDVRATLVMITERAGSRIDPPSSNAPDNDVQRQLEAANAVGAAYLARLHIYTKNGSQQNLDIAERLASTWESYAGEGAASGGSAGTGIGGSVATAIASAADTKLLVNQVTSGEVGLKALTTMSDVEPPFAMGDED